MAPKRGRRNVGAETWAPKRGWLIRGGATANRAVEPAAWVAGALVVGVRERYGAALGHRWQIVLSNRPVHAECRRLERQSVPVTTAEGPVPTECPCKRQRVGLVGICAVLQLQAQVNRTDGVAGNARRAGDLSRAPEWALRHHVRRARGLPRDVF